MEAHASNGSRASATACLRCRRQKLKCSRERPICKRCVRLKAECCYPAPPERKKLGRRGSVDNDNVNDNRTVPSLVLTNPPLPSQSSLSHVAPHLHSQSRYRDATHFAGPGSGPTANTTSKGAADGSTPARSPFDRPLSHGYKPASSPMARKPRSTVAASVVREEQEINVSDEVALFLIDVYFHRHYQSQLLLEKQSFIANYLAGQVPQYLSFAVFALATIFLGGSTNPTLPEEITIADISNTNWVSVGDMWAQQASRAALSEADLPCIERVQGCQILAMYWFSRSQTLRTNMHAAIAQRTCRLLRDDHSHGVARRDQAQVSTSVLDEASGVTEVNSRCYWACWMTRCVSQSNAHFEGTCWEDVSGRPLPLDEDEFSNDEASNQKIILDSRGQIVLANESRQVTQIGFLQALILLHGFWWEVQDFVRQLQRHSTSATVAVSTLYALDKKLDDCYSIMRVDLKHYTNHTTTHLPSKSYHAFCLSYLYHSCLCALHSSVVPTLSGIVWPLAFPPKVAQLSAEEALRHAGEMADMTADLLSKKPDFSRLWPLMGHGAYVSMTIQLRASLALRVLNRSHLERAQLHRELVDGIAKFWMPLRAICANMERILSYVAALAPTDPSSIPTSEESNSLNVPNNISHLAVNTLDQENPDCNHDIYTYVADDDVENNNNATLEESLPEQDDMIIDGVSFRGNQIGKEPRITMPSSADASILANSGGSTRKGIADQIDLAQGMPLVLEESSWDQDMAVLLDMPSIDFDWNDMFSS